MTDPIRRTIDIPPGFRSTEVGRFVSQLDDQSRRLRENTRDLTVEELGWQPAPGTNTIGMLLAHLAIVEVFWTDTALAPGVAPDPDSYDTMPLLGIGTDDDGMPIPADAGPPATLQNKGLAFFDDLLDRARAHLTRVARDLTDADLDREHARRRADGTEVRIHGRWTLYHVLEHLAGHYGQVLLLRHQYRVRAPVPAAAQDRAS